ncbi:hypothetical protein RP20_CCG013923 [Aedes albopictus]|nr:hypothetical protein RP20_CCG013923 [Aedes albopictus]
MANPNVPVAFVEFKDVASAAAAMCALQGKYLLSSDRGAMRIEFAKSKMAADVSSHHFYHLHMQQREQQQQQYQQQNHHQPTTATVIDNSYINGTNGNGLGFDFGNGISTGRFSSVNNNNSNGLYAIAVPQPRA